uniref:Cholinephosphotransferase 1 n=1 Tax=Ursus maritimus TaxID=29073 RepID=A0A452UZB7_URSMA
MHNPSLTVPCLCLQFLKISSHEKMKWVGVAFVDPPSTRSLFCNYPCFEKTPGRKAPVVPGQWISNLEPVLQICRLEKEDDSFQAPYWTYLLCALGLFIYQSLDAIDGKQARRTNSCSPLGELFDHGCDSLSTVFMAVGASVAVRLGTHPDWLFFCSFIGMFMFYCAHWQTYVSGVLRFGKVDVTEIQLALVTVFVLSTFGGAAMWDSTIPILEIKLKIFPVLGVVGGAIFSCSNYFHVILHGGVGKNGSTIAGTSVLSPGLHIGIIIILAIMIYKKSATNVFEKHPCLYTLMFGCVFAKVSQKLVIAHMTKSELYLQDTVFFGPGLLFLDQYFNNFVDEYIVLWIAMVISSFDMMMYFSALCLQISRHLHLNIFKTSYHEAPEQVQVLPSKSHQNNMD